MESTAKPLRIPRRAASRSQGEGAPQFVSANAGDHGPIYSLLRAVQRAPSREDFATWLDEPSYQPADRLLLKQRDAFLGHVQVRHYGAWFGELRLPVVSLQDLAVLPEYAEAGWDRRLLEEAERAMRESNAVLSMLRTNRPALLQTYGWTRPESQGFSCAGVHDILAHLSLAKASKLRRRKQLHIRRWRHVELDAVQDIYCRTLAPQWGALCRSEDYWQWLVGRQAHSELLVAVSGPDCWDDFQKTPDIVGYAVTHGPRIVELCCLPGYVRAAPRLLTRVCQDAIERDDPSISLHTPVTDPLHEQMVTAGGSWCRDEDCPQGALLVKLLDPVRWVESIYPLLRERAKEAELPRPWSVCFAISHPAGERNYRFTLSRRSSHLVLEPPAAKRQAEVCCDQETFSALLMGCLNVSEARSEGGLTIHDDTVARHLAILFPRAFFWQSQFDGIRF